MLARQDPSHSTASAASAIDQIQQALASAATPGTFATRHTARVTDLHLDVVGIGAVPLPLSPAIALRLCDIARPARYGLREQTLLDRRVRDTWEIGKRQIKIDARHWQRTFAPKLELIARDLGLPVGAKLRAELHNLLVYGPGQFFAPHRDSEKTDGMIGSLVVLLPSQSKGGALVIEHHDEKVSYRGSSDQLVLVAFYADCRHEVRPVTTGYRAALTYNLFVDGGTRTPERPAAKPLATLADLVREYFANPRPARGPHWPSKGAPERLVYLLDHEYTQKGLSWQRLKNGDAVRASLLRGVAERLDCEIVLALADVHETWSCEDDWEYDGGRYGYGRRRRHSWDGRSDKDNSDEHDSDGDDEVAGNDEDYTLTELCNSDIELRHWIAPSNKRVETISDEVVDDEICFTKPSVELEPFRSEHEGYTGNAGNTVDRWYHRAAVLLWPRARTFAIRTRASPAWGIKTIANALARGAADVARRDIAEMLPFWSEVAPGEQAPGFVDQLLRVAAELDDAKLAATLVDPIAIDRMTPPMVKHWSALLGRYGLSWCWEVFSRWISRDENGHDLTRRATWLVSLPKLCAPLCASNDKDAIELVRRVARAQWAWFEKPIKQWVDNLPSSYTLKTIDGMSRPIVGLLAAASLAGDRDLQSTIVERLTTQRGYPITGAIAVLRSGVPQGGVALGLAPLHDDCMLTLSRLASTPPRAPGDWSMATLIRCKCELCTRLVRFLRATNEQQLEWPLAKERRRHVHGMISSHELPVTHVTRRVGSPHTLVLMKTRALFTRDVAEHAAWVRDLAWLAEVAKNFTTTKRPSTPSVRSSPRDAPRPPGKPSNPSAKKASPSVRQLAAVEALRERVNVARLVIRSDRVDYGFSFRSSPTTGTK